MEATEISEGNKLIAEFMEHGYWQAWKVDGYKPYWADQFLTEDEAQKQIDRSGERVSANLHAKFISKDYLESWSLLMPVVEKIEQLKGGEFGVHILDVTCTIKSTSIFEELKILHITRVKIEAVWLAVVDFIKYHNSLN